MGIETSGTVVKVTTQWWLKVNTKPVRTSAMDGAAFPHIIKVRYTANGTEYTKRKWIGALDRAPEVGSRVKVIYDEAKPSKAKIL